MVCKVNVFLIKKIKYKKKAYICKTVTLFFELLDYGKLMKIRHIYINM